VSPSVRSPTTGSRVAWGFWLTMARCCPTSAFSNVDFPTLGAPARAMWPERLVMAVGIPGSSARPRGSLNQRLRALGGWVHNLARRLHAGDRHGLRVDEP